MKTKLSQIDGLPEVLGYQEAAIDLNKINIWGDITLPVKFTTDAAVTAASVLVELDPGSNIAQLYYADGTAVTSLSAGAHEVIYNSALDRFVLTAPMVKPTVGATLYTYNNIGGAF